MPGFCNARLKKKDRITIVEGGEKFRESGRIWLKPLNKYFSGNNNNNVLAAAVFIRVAAHQQKTLQQTQLFLFFQNKILPLFILLHSFPQEQILRTFFRYTN